MANWVNSVYPSYKNRVRLFFHCLIRFHTSYYCGEFVEILGGFHVWTQLWSIGCFNCGRVIEKANKEEDGESSSTLRKRARKT